MVPWALLVLLEKEELEVPEDLKEHLVCREYLEVLVDLDVLDLQVKQELLVSLAEMENREENIARMIYEKFARLF
jgi:hypothetical protein